MKNILKLLSSNKYKLILLILMIALSLALLFMGLFLEDGILQQSINDITKELGYPLFSKELSEFIKLTSVVPGSSFQTYYNMFLAGFIMLIVLSSILIAYVLFISLKKRNKEVTVPLDEEPKEKKVSKKKTTKKKSK